MKLLLTATTFALAAHMAQAEGSQCAGVGEIAYGVAAARDAGASKEAVSQIAKGDGDVARITRGLIEVVYSKPNVPPALFKTLTQETCQRALDDNSAAEDYR